MGKSLATDRLTEQCQCGKVELAASGRPILAVTCYCVDCQEAGHRFEQLPSAPPVLDADGGTEYVLFRKDRVQCTKGAELLEEHRLKPESPTRRVIATCCNAPMFLDVTQGHWLSLYRKRFANGAPPIEMRAMTKSRPGGTALPNDVPNYPGFSGKFMLKLLGAWLAMGFRRPKINLGAARESA